jgi:hypothetical protein
MSLANSSSPQTATEYVIQHSHAERGQFARLEENDARGRWLKPVQEQLPNFTA